MDRFKKMKGYIIANPTYSLTRSMTVHLICFTLWTQERTSDSIQLLEIIGKDLICTLSSPLIKSYYSTTEYPSR